MVCFCSPTWKDFVDIQAIRIFTKWNPVLTLLADMYFSVTTQYLKSKRVIACCASLLYKWFVSYLPTTPTFRDVGSNVLWVKKLMELERLAIKWYDSNPEGTIMIIGYGDYENVPLIGRLDCINYNPLLARCQLGYPIEMRLY